MHREAFHKEEGARLLITVNSLAHNLNGQMCLRKVELIDKRQQ